MKHLFNEVASSVGGEDYYAITDSIPFDILLHQWNLTRFVVSRSVAGGIW